MDVAVKALVLAVYAAPILTIGLTLIPVQWAVLTFVILGLLLARASRHTDDAGAILISR
jgi:hypothetical protein